MAFSFLSYWNYGSKYCGIEYNSNPEGTINIFGLSAVKKKEEFEIEKTFQTSSPGECTKSLPKNQHAFLSITGNQVLIKSTVNTGPAAKVVSSAFPNVDLNDFYFEILKNSSGSIVALCRRDQVHQIIISFEKHNITIIGFSLGFSSIQNLLGVIESKEIYLSSYNITTDGKKITSIEKAGKEQKEVTNTLSGTVVSSNFLLPLAAIFNYSAGNVHIVSNFDHRNLELTEEHHQKVFFRKGLVTAVTLLLVMLLINFMLFSGYHSELQQMTGRYEAEISQKQVYDETYDEVIGKEKIVENILNNSNSRSSFYLNRLVVSKPASVLLKEYGYQPLLKQVKEKEPISFEQNVIRIAGESKEKGDFSQWIKDLEESSWIREVKVSDFGYSSPGTSDFILTLKLD